MLVIRLQRMGKKNQPLFRVVLVEKGAPIKGKYIERLGFLDPCKKKWNLDSERIKYWLGRGAKPSDTIFNLLVKEKILKGPKRKIKIKRKKKEKKEVKLKEEKKK